MPLSSLSEKQSYSRSQWALSPKDLLENAENGLQDQPNRRSEQTGLGTGGGP